MIHAWTIDHLIGFRTEVGYGRTRWESLDLGAREAAHTEGRRVLEKLDPDQLILRDEVIYSVGRAI
jgi:hypothetical protein